MKRLITIVAAGSGFLGTGCARPESPIDRAAFLAASGQERTAVAELRDYLREHPGAIAERRLLVRLYATQGRLRVAEREVARLAEHVPAGSPIPWVERGHILELSHRYDEALAMYDRAADVAPVDPLGPRTGGLRAARWGELELASPRLEEALRRNPADAPVWHALGLVRLHLGNLPAAEHAYRQGLRADPDALENRLGLATLALHRSRPREALVHYDAILARRPGFADGYLGKAWALMALGRLDTARHILDEAERRGADPGALAAQRRLLSGLQSKREHEKNR